jgi:sugar O-acyltransferase (sialic acid O-acetyltransferase NeuD family)
MDATPLILVGASGLATEVAASARRSGRPVLGCVDDDPRLAGTTLAGGVPILGTSESLAAVEALSGGEGSDILVCIGHGSVRRRVVEQLARQGVTAQRFATVVDDLAVVPPDTVIGPGSILLAGVVVTAPIGIGAHVVVMPHVTLTHDVVIDDYVTIAGGVQLGGAVHVRPEAYLGMSASVRPGVTVGAASTLGMGSALLTDLPDGETWVGVPARHLR